MLHQVPNQWALFSNPSASRKQAFRKKSFRAICPHYFFRVWIGWYYTSKACAPRPLTVILIRLSIYISEHIIQIDTFLQCPDSILLGRSCATLPFKSFELFWRKIWLYQCMSSHFHPSFPLQVQINFGTLVSLWG